METNSESDTLTLNKMNGSVYLSSPRPCLQASGGNDIPEHFPHTVLEGQATRTHEGN